MSYRVLVIGDSWHGSDCTGLARGLRELGHAVELIGSDQFLPKTDGSFNSRVFRRLASSFYKHQFNKYILAQLSLVRPDFVIVFKGNHVEPSTLVSIRKSDTWLCNFYPDISFFAHGAVAKEGWPIYDRIFTTKKHGAEEMLEQLGLENVSFLQHGFDKYVHRPISAILAIPAALHCDISFIGGWSPNKEEHLCGLVTGINGLDLKIWGDRWDNSRYQDLKMTIQGNPVFGDFYALAISASKINLGLLQDQQGSAKSGDQVTSRTFHIPASGGFLLHERTEEVLGYFEEGKEIACFGSSEELIEKVQYYLANEKERLKIAKAGFERCLKENSLANRAQVIVEKYESEAIK